MAEHRPVPPSARRLSLARRAGLHASSPLLVGAAASAAALLAAATLAPAAAARLRASLEAAVSSSASPSVLTLADAPHAILSLALPLLAAAAITAALAHVSQTRALWLPRRRISGAPVPPHDPAARIRASTFDLTAAAVLACTAFLWLWSLAPRLASLPSLAPPSALAAASSLLASALATLAIAWALLGILDALLRHARLAHSLRMTPHDKREDDRLSGLDPRWRAHRARSSRTPSLSDATVLLLGEDIAVAISWDAARRPIPTRTATGRAARATQLLGLARRHRVPVHRDPTLAAALVSSDGPVPEPHWARLAEIIAALRT
jgi:flagellar biosynthetic protein FlhB